MELASDLAALKRKTDAMGVWIQVPRPGVMWREPVPLRLKGITLSEVVIRLRRGGFEEI